MKTATCILLTCTAMVAVTASARAADLPTAQPAPAAHSPVSACTTVQDYVVNDCPLTWYGITLYGAIDVGVGWVSHGSPVNGYNYEPLAEFPEDEEFPVFQRAVRPARA